MKEIKYHYKKKRERPVNEETIVRLDRDIQEVDNELSAQRRKTKDMHMEYLRRKKNK